MVDFLPVHLHRLFTTPSMLYFILQYSIVLHSNLFTSCDAKRTLLLENHIGNIPEEVMKVWIAMTKADGFGQKVSDQTHHGGESFGVGSHNRRKNMSANRGIRYRDDPLEALPHLPSLDQLAASYDHIKVGKRMKDDVWFPEWTGANQVVLQQRDSVQWPQAQATGDVCNLPQVIGTGPYRIPRWHFSDNSKRCELFYYSGCCGNSNNFPSPQACQVLCEVDPCTQPKDAGIGSLQISRFHFNKESKICEQFTYFGSGGNRNNFASVSECRAVCPEMPNPCAFGTPMEDGSGGFMKCGFSVVVTNTCPAEHYCHVGATVSTTLCCPNGETDRCSQTVSEGFGSEDLLRFAFDPATQKCRQFAYKGLQGNQNNFLTQSDCENACFVNPCAIGDPGRSDEGQLLQCSSLNPTVCPSGMYCHIGAKPQTTLCCKTQGEDICSMQPSEGTGSALLKRYYFNPSTKSCMTMSYRGLKGNANNFLNEQDCKKTCPVFQNPCLIGDVARDQEGRPRFCRPSTTCGQGLYCHVGSRPDNTVCCRTVGNECELELAEGTGNAALKRFYFDPEIRRCRPFTYRGMRGNDNNFISQKMCANACPVFTNPCPESVAGALSEDLPAPCSASGQCTRGYWCHRGETHETTVCCRGGENRCSLPLQLGMGAAALPRWQFVMESRKCVPFTYKGIYGNANNFVSNEECEQICPAWINACKQGLPLLSVENKPRGCTTEIFTCPEGYFCHVGGDTDTTMCCESTANPCTLPVDEGVGTGTLPRWHFEPDTRSCQVFTYLGTKGNANNYLRKDECEADCPVFTNPCPSGEPAANPTSGNPKSCSPLATAGPLACGNNYWCHAGETVDTTVCCPNKGDPCEYAVSGGVGLASLERWFFNGASKTCETFLYKGLQGNPNNFLTREACEIQCPIFVNPCPSALSPNQLVYCSPSQASACPLTFWCHVGIDERSSVCCPDAGDPCQLPKNQGQGGAALSRWHYDVQSKSCQQFSYAGFRGNQNNFLTQSLCEAACPVWINPCPAGFPILDGAKRPVTCRRDRPCPAETHWCHVGLQEDTTVCCPGRQDPCTLLKSDGTGEENLPRFYFDPVRRECTPFSYRGVKGNQNNFLTADDCEQVCPVLDNPCASGPYSRDLDGRPIKCSITTGCADSHWCHFGSTSDNTLCCPNAGNPCSQPLNEGQGSGQLQRFHFNPVLRQCQPFSYRGVLGNQNNFLSKEDCENECPVFKNPCQGIPVTDGTGRVQPCSQLNLDACGPNNYCHIGGTADTTVCCQGGTNKCDQSKEEGEGQFSLSRFHFNSGSRQCENFVYKGSKGNANNFITKLQCEQECPVFSNPCANGPMATLPDGQPQYCSQSDDSCGPGHWCHRGASPEATVCCPGTEDPCSQALHTGSGSDSLQRWYYNALAKKCAQFVYNGILGNQNNFLSQADCEDSCPVFPNPCPSGEPLLGPDRRPSSCLFGDNSCGPSFWCHLGSGPGTTVCCPGVLVDACIGMPPIEGQGQSNLDRFYFDNETKLCRSFVYRGEKGNQNAFATKEDCESTCQVFQNPCPLDITPPPNFCSQESPSCSQGDWCHIGATKETTLCCPEAQSDICELELAQGNGNQSLQRYYFNREARQCVIFSYRGAKGNQNNFLTMSDCEDYCPVFHNPCSTGQALFDPSGAPQKCNMDNPLDSCPRSYWCHVGASEESTVCCSGALDACKIERDPGQGSDSLSRWYYDQSSRKCSQFMYSGAMGNQNNFLSQEMCQQTCREFENPCTGQPATNPTGQVIFCSRANRDCPVNFWCHVGASPETTLCCPGPTNPCSVPLAPGTGSANMQRFYYNADRRECVEFVYNGRNGNQNNFVNLRECQETCPVWKNPCPGGMPTPSTSSISQPLRCTGGTPDSCPDGNWCHPGATVEDTVCCPGNATEVCKLAKEIGEGQSQLRRWFFDRVTAKCHEFIYNGRSGNANNFLTKEQCLKSCPEWQDPCSVGRAFMYSDGVTPQECDVEAEDEDQCPPGYFCHAGTDSNVCCRSVGNPCATPRVSGEGSSNLVRYYYNPSREDCEEFVYKGAKGNQNNFLQKERCEKMCVPEKNPCFPGDEPFREGRRNMVCLSSDPSSCPPTHYCHSGADTRSSVCCPKRGDTCNQALLPGSGPHRLPRWYYNRLEDACLPFTYSGEQGNENNFVQKSTCEAACPGYRDYCPHAKPLMISGSPAECGIETTCPHSNYVCHISTIKATSVCCADPAWFCILPQDPGRCSDFTTRYGYSRETGTCAPFQYGGCAGNINNFETIEQCTNVCCDKGF